MKNHCESCVHKGICKYEETYKVEYIKYNNATEKPFELSLFCHNHKVSAIMRDSFNPFDA